MSDEKYNGWSNYETWCCNLWLTNDAGDDEMLREWAQECYNNAEADQYFTRLERATLDLSDKIKDYIEESQDEFMSHQQTGMFTDLLNSAVSAIDYHEIAEGFMEDVDQEIEPELDE